MTATAFRGLLNSFSFQLQLPVLLTRVVQSQEIMPLRDLQSFLALTVAGINLGGRFGYFLFLFCSGRGKGSPRPAGGGGRFFIENPRRGGSRRGRGAAGPGGCLRRIGDFGGGGG